MHHLSHMMDYFRPDAGQLLGLRGLLLRMCGLLLRMCGLLLRMCGLLLRICGLLLRIRGLLLRIRGPLLRIREDTWPPVEDTWPPVEDMWPPVEDMWPPVEAMSAVEAVSSSLYHGPLTNVEEKGKTFNHYNDFFAAREMHQKELIKVESPKDRQICESRARNPGVKNAKVYEWEKTQSSGGREVYKQVKVNKRRNEDVYFYYKPYQ